MQTITAKKPSKPDCFSDTRSQRQLRWRTASGSRGREQVGACSGDTSGATAPANNSQLAMKPSMRALAELWPRGIPRLQRLDARRARTLRRHAGDGETSEDIALTRIAGAEPPSAHPSSEEKQQALRTIDPRLAVQAVCPNPNYAATARYPPSSELSGCHDELARNAMDTTMAATTATSGKRSTQRLRGRPTELVILKHSLCRLDPPTLRAVTYDPPRAGWLCLDIDHGVGNTAMRRCWRLRDWSWRWYRVMGFSPDPTRRPAADTRRPTNRRLGNVSRLRAEPAQLAKGVAEAITSLGASGAGIPSTNQDHAHTEVEVEVPLSAVETPLFDAQWRSAQEAIASRDTEEEAAALGYMRATAPSGGIGTHWVMWPQIAKPFDPATPSMLLFNERREPPVLVGYSYALQSPILPGGFAGGNDHWHQHRGLCVDDGWVVREQAAGPQACGGTYIAGGDFWMLHAWVVPGYDNRKGTFAPFNPKLCPRNVGTPDVNRCPA